MQKVDVLILGAGFGGSLLGAILASHGRSVALIDRSRHPRFAIGESSTPLADASLERIAQKYSLPEIAPLARYGWWKRAYPALLCGRKRGFTYFGHAAGFDPRQGDFPEQRMLAMASDGDESSDTHWLRSDVDAFFFRLAQSHGTMCFEACRYMLRRVPEGWHLEGTAEDREVVIQSDFVIDATGSATGVLAALQIEDQTGTLRTNSGAVFAHFSGVRPCQQMLLDAGLDVTAFPFDCDAAAVHHVLDDGWMYQLRFDDDTVSAGFVFDQRRPQQQGRDTAGSPVDDWNGRMQRYPFLRQQFARAAVVRPAGGLQRVPRLQRLTTQAAGENWAVLASTAGLIDPLHSTGIAHTLFCVERLAAILLNDLNPSQRRQRLEDYSQMLITEIRCVDELVEGCYAALPDFALWCDWTMVYFAAVTSMESLAPEGVAVGDRATGFLRALDPEFRRVLKTARLQLSRCGSCDRRAWQRRQFVDWLRDAIRPWNHAGLLDESCDRLYTSTSARR